MSARLHEELLVEMFQHIAQLGPRKGVAELSRQWTKLVDENGLQFAIALLECLVAKGQEWRKRISRAIKRPRQSMGKFAAEISPILAPRRQGETDRRKTIPPQIIGAPRHPKTQLAVEFSKEDLGLFDLHQMFDKLPDPKDGPFALDILFKDEPIYIYGLAALAAWCARNCAQVTYDAPSRAYLDRIGFPEAVKGMVARRKVGFDPENYIALTQLGVEGEPDTGAIAKDIVRLFAPHLNIEKPEQSSLSIIIAELVENVYRHAESKAPGFVVAQVHPKARKLMLAIADTGIGVYASFTRSDMPEARRLARTPKEALNAAVSPCVSSKKINQSGYGLYITKKLCDLNQGSFRLTSGSHTLIDMPRSSRRGIHPRPKVRHKAWQGTFVGLLLSAGKSLDIDKVWKTLPVPDGYEREDFFE